MSTAPSSAAPLVAYALYGPWDGRELRAWRRTWLKDQAFIYIPDEPKGEWARFYHATHGAFGEVRGRDYMSRTRVDANLVWAVLHANETFPNAKWLFVVDADSFVFPATVAHHARQHDPNLPFIIGWSSYRNGLALRAPSYLDCATAPHCASDAYDKAGNPPWSNSCCVCPVSRRWHHAPAAAAAAPAATCRDCPPPSARRAEEGGGGQSARAAGLTPLLTAAARTRRRLGALSTPRLANNPPSRLRDVALAHAGRAHHAGDFRGGAPRARPRLRATRGGPAAPRGGGGGPVAAAARTAAASAAGVRSHYELDAAHGRAHYAAAPYGIFGGNGVLLSRGLVDSIGAAELALCARRLVCGSSDMRLAACLHNLADAYTRHVTANMKFAHTRLRRRNGSTPVRALGRTDRFRNDLYSVFSRQPATQQSILAAFDERGACPWAMHKLEPADADVVYRHARHCVDETEPPPPALPYPLPAPIQKWMDCHGQAARAGDGRGRDLHMDSCRQALVDAKQAVVAAR